jgi:hypothetical protein
MPTPLPVVGNIATGAVTDNTIEFVAIASAAGATAAALALVATQLQAINAKILLSNRGVAIGVKSATAGSDVAVTQAVIQRRNALAGPLDQLPIPPNPPGI